MTSPFLKLKKMNPNINLKLKSKVKPFIKFYGITNLTPYLKHNSFKFNKLSGIV